MLYSIINSTTGKYCSVGHTLGFHPQTSKVRTTLYSIINSITDRKVLLSSFHLNGQTLGFHPQTQKMEPPCTASQIPPQGTTTYAAATSNQLFLAYHYLVKQTNPED